MSHVNQTDCTSIFHAVGTQKKTAFSERVFEVETIKKTKHTFLWIEILSHCSLKLLIVGWRVRINWWNTQGQLAGIVVRLHKKWSVDHWKIIFFFYSLLMLDDCSVFYFLYCWVLFALGINCVVSIFVGQIRTNWLEYFCEYFNWWVLGSDAQPFLYSYVVISILIFSYHVVRLS